MKTLLVVLSFLVLGGCASKQRFQQHLVQSAGPNSLSGEVLWLKNKKDSLDVRVRLVNNYPHPVHFDKPALAYQGRVGELRNEVPRLLEPGQSLTMVYIFRFEPQIGPAGDATFQLASVYRGYGGDKNPPRLNPLSLHFKFDNRWWERMRFSHFLQLHEN